jgi:hypothetical protein
MHFCAPPKFRILVAGIVSPSDPSRGIPATIARTGFELQQIVLPNGTMRIGGPMNKPAPPTALAHTAAIQVAAPDYWDPSAVVPPPFYIKEEVQAFDVYLTASDNFGMGEGSGTGPIAAIATELAASLNAIDGVTASSDGVDMVYITSTRPDETLPIKASGDFSAVLGAVSFLVSSGGTMLSTAPEYRRTFYVTKPVKTQNPPVALP